MDQGAIDKVGQVIKIKTLKNKTAPPFRNPQTNFYFDNFSPFCTGDYDIAAEVNNIALTYGVVERRGAVGITSVMRSGTARRR